MTANLPSKSMGVRGAVFSIKHRKRDYRPRWYLWYFLLFFLIFSIIKRFNAIYRHFKKDLEQERVKKRVITLKCLKLAISKD